MYREQWASARFTLKECNCITHIRGLPVLPRTTCADSSVLLVWHLAVAGKNPVLVSYSAASMI